MDMLCVAFQFLMLLIGCSTAWFWSPSPKYPCEEKRPATKPYYFGKTSLWCMLRNKRSSPSVGTLWPLHSWIYYDEHYVEFGISDGAVSDTKTYSISTDHPAEGDKCSYWLDGSSPQGYSGLGMDCIRGCAMNYKNTHGDYHILTNNCHHFVNKISEVLCEAEQCPSWCQT